MNQLPERPNRPEVRASDADRHRVADILRDAAAEGRLSLEELEERLEGVYAAKTYAELEPFTADLPAGGTTPSAPPLPSTDPRIGGTPTSSVSVAILSGTTRKGAWVVPAAFTAVAFWGGVQLDLREARFAAPEVVIRAFAVMGGIEIIVSEDVDVVVSGVGIMGGFDDTSETETGTGRGPMVRVTGLAFWGGVEVKRRPRDDRADRPALEQG